MKIGILGATSYVGFNLIKIIQSEYPEIKLKIAGRNIAKLEYLREKYNCVASIHQTNIGDDISEIVKECDAVVDLAFQISGIPSFVIKDSITHAKKLVDSCLKYSVKNLIIIGSVAIYGEPIIKYNFTEVPIPQLVKPNSFYGRVKLIVEKEAWERAKNKSINLFLIRSGHIFGESSKMVNGILQKLINNDTALLKGKTCFSNATTTNGLCRSIIRLSINDSISGKYTANHVDLTDISYEEIVNKLAGILNIIPSHSIYFDEVKENNKSFSFIKKYLGQISMLQSKIGLWDLGLSASLISKYKPNFSAYKINTSIQYEQNYGLKHLYDSAKVIHTSKLCGECLTKIQFENEIKLISSWAKKVGYDTL